MSEGKKNTGAAVINAICRVGRLAADRSEWAVLEKPTLAALLNAVPAGQTAPDLAIEIDGDATFLDIDSHHLVQKPTAEALDRWLLDILPEPDAAWRTHGSGLRLMFIGPCHRPRAVAAAMSSPPVFKAELKSISRHPLSTRTDKPGTVCGPVIYGAADCTAPFEFRLGGNFTPDLRAQALAILGMQDGGRYPHDRCPIAPRAHTNAADCVVVYANVVKCWRCEGAGTSYRPGLKPGIYPLAAAVGTEATDLERLAANWVHWTQAFVELSHVYPNLGPQVLREAYRLALIARSKPETEGGENDPRLVKVFQPALDFVWGNGCWLANDHYSVRIVDADAADSVPYCQYVAKNDNGELIIAVDKARKSQFKNSTPRGYKPVRPYRGIDLRVDDARTVPVQLQPAPKYAVRLLSNPLALADCLKQIDRGFPGVDRTYLQGALAAGICAARGGGRKPQLCADGPSGAGKGETVRLAASFLGDDAIKVRIGAEEELNRYLGSAIVSGRRFLIIDELGKIESLFKRFSSLLQLSSTITWRPLYRPAVTTEFDAALFYPSVNFPDWLKRSTEFCRRVRRVRLVLRVPEWSATCGGETILWRDRTADNARAANSLLTHVYNICSANSFEWEACANAFGLGRLDDDIDAPDAEEFRDLYRYCRGDLPGQPEFLTDSGFVRGWVNLGTGRAKEIVEALIDFDAGDFKKAQKQAKFNLEALPWNNLLGFNDPPVRFRARIHGGKFGGRFEIPFGIKGKEQINSDLPPIQASPLIPAPAPATDDMDELGRANLRAAGVTMGHVVPF